LPISNALEINQHTTNGKNLSRGVAESPKSGLGFIPYNGNSIGVANSL